MMKKRKKNMFPLGALGKFKTKDQLSKKYVRLNDEEKRYKDVHSVVQDLNQRYQSCKGNFPLLRYGDLKNMIKTCVTDEMMEKAKMYSVTGTVEGAVGGTVEEDDKPFGLRGTSKQLLATIGGYTSGKDEVSKMPKEDIVEAIEEKKRNIERGKFLIVRLQKLKRDYEESKHHFPPRRYSKMKAMIKEVIRDKDP